MGALTDLTVPELAAIIAQASAEILKKSAPAEQPDTTLRALLNVDEAAPLFGPGPETLRKRARSDAAIRACTVDNGTARVVFDPAKVEQYRKRRAG
jgi:hypothetical protein